MKQGVLTFLAMMKREELFTRQPQIPRRSDYDSEGEVEGEEVTMIARGVEGEEVTTIARGRSRGKR